MKPACTPQRKAQASPNSTGSPKRPAGLLAARSLATSSRLRPVLAAAAFIVVRSRSVSNGPGSRLLMVTLLITVLRARPATKPVRPARAPLDRPRLSIGALDRKSVVQGKRGAVRVDIGGTSIL